MALFEVELSVNNELDKSGKIVLKENKCQTRKIFGLTVQKATYIRNTIKQDIEIGPKGLGFTSANL